MFSGTLSDIHHDPGTTHQGQSQFFSFTQFLYQKNPIRSNCWICSTYLFKKKNSVNLKARYTIWPRRRNFENYVITQRATYLWNLEVSFFPGHSRGLSQSTRIKQSLRQPVAESRIVGMAEFRVTRGAEEVSTSLQCIDQIKEALQLQKRKEKKT